MVAGIRVALIWPAYETGRMTPPSTYETDAASLLSERHRGNLGLTRFQIVPEAGLTTTRNLARTGRLLGF